jgi:hypothetical protein
MRSVEHPLRSTRSGLRSLAMLVVGSPFLTVWN